MRGLWAMGAAAVAVCGVLAAPAGLAGAEQESAQQVISRLQNEGYTVNIDRVGSAPLDKCTVTGVRNPQQVTQWVPYTGPGRSFGGDRDHVLVEVVTSQSISVSLNCSR